MGHMGFGGMYALRKPETTSEDVFQKAFLMWVTKGPQQCERDRVWASVDPSAKIMLGRAVPKVGTDPFQNNVDKGVGIEG